jgi:glycosyltransferase involved in cell wall biosynthesis
MQPSIAAIAARIRKKNIIFHIHETHSSQFFFGRFYNLIRKNIKSKDIFVSEYIASLESFDFKRSAIIHNSISNEFILSAQQHTYSHLIDNIFSVLMVCSLRDYKGIPEFIELCYSLQLNKQIHFTLVLDASKNEIDEYFCGVFISDNLTIHARTENPSQFYKKTSLLLNLSRPDQWIETFGLTIVEAMSFGIPCIVPTIGGPTEIINDNINGFHISCYNIKAIAMKIEELAKDAAQCRKLSNNAKEKSKLFTPSIYKTNINNFLNESH